MNFFIFLFLIPLTFATTPPNCKELGNIVEGYEKDLMRKGLAQEVCNELDPAKIMNPENPDTSIFSQEDIALFDEHKCRNLSVIETKISDLENELALLQGFEKLKADVKEQKSKAADKDEKVAIESGRKFVDALNTAQTLDTLLTVQDKNGEIILNRFLHIPKQDRQDPEKFKLALTELCKGKEKSSPCALSLTPSQATIDDINMLLEQPINNETVEKWRGAIAIKKTDGKNYSFSQMAKELKDSFVKIDNNDLSISRKELQVIQNLPDFESVKGLEFLQDLKKQKGAETFVSASKFKFLVEDLTGRQAYEMTSKISYLYSEHEKNLNDAQKASCKGSSQSLSEALNCMNALKEFSKDKGQGDNSLSTLNKMLRSLENSKSYHDILVGVSQRCINPSLMETPESLGMSDECLKKLNGDITSLPKKLRALYLLKDKIGEENQKLMVYRNFAMKKWAKCSEHSRSSIVGECDDAFTSYISKEAVSLSNNVAKLSVVYKPKDEHRAKAEAECLKEDKERTRIQEQLCAFFNDTTSNILEADKEKKNPDTFQAPVEAPDGGHNPQREAWVRGLANITRDMVNQYQSQQNQYRPMMNPYMYNYSPYNSGRAMMGISDTILFNARYYGAYGYYMPTMGYQPYTAFGSKPTTAYTPYASSTSAYFTTK
jgi:hypothetical protein